MIQYKTIVGLNNIIQYRVIYSRIERYDKLHDPSKIEQ